MWQFKTQVKCDEKKKNPIISRVIAFTNANISIPLLVFKLALYLHKGGIKKCTILTIIEAFVYIEIQNKGPQGLHRTISNQTVLSGGPYFTSL